MLTPSSIEATRPITQDLLDQDQHLVPVEGSPLELLVQDSTPYMQASSDGDVEPTASSAAGVLATFGENVQKASQRVSADGETSDHDDTMETVTENLAETIRSTLDTARNAIVPKARELYEKYGEQMRHMETDAQQPVVIIPNIYHDIWTMSELSGLVERFENSQIEVYRFGTSLPNLSYEQIRPMLNTQISSLDAVIEDWIEDMPDGKIQSIYQQFFVHTGGPSVSVGHSTNAVHKTAEGLDRNDILAIYLIAQGFEDHIPDGLNVSLSELRGMLARTREQAGRAIMQEIKRRQRDWRNRIMVFSVRENEWDFGTANQKRLIVHVNMDVYQHYLDEGGTVESIYGGAMRGTAMTFRDLMDNKVDNENFYHKRLALHNQRVTSKMYHAKRESARLTLVNCINELPEDQLRAPRSVLHNRLLQVLGNYQQKDFDNELVAIRNLVAEVLYGDWPGALMVLKAMDQAERDNPNLAPRECALYALIDLMARWSASRIAVKYV